MTPSLRTSLWVWGCLGLFLLSRLPAMQCPYQLNVDEGQVLAQAMRYEHDLTPWRAVDGETGGPILSWVPLLAHEAGLPFSFCTIHILAAICLVGTLLATFAAVRALLGEEPALVALAAGAWWLALTPGADFIHYSSELVPGLFLSLALVLWSGRKPGDTGGAGRVLWAGVLLGLIPWAKLQAVPIGLALGIWMLADLGSSRRWGQAVVLLAGAVLPSAALLAWVARAGAWDQFWNSYIVANLSRAAGKPWGQQATNLAHFVLFGEGAGWFLSTGLLLAGALGLRRLVGCRRLPPRIWALAILLLLAAIFALLRPVTRFPHYQQLCLVPLLLLVACAASVLLGIGQAGDSRRRAAWWILVLGLLPLPAAYFLRYEGPRVLGETWSYQRSRAFEVQSFVLSSVQSLAPHPESLAVWGWAPYLYVDLGVAPGTRDAGYTSLHDGNPSQDFMRAAFLRDLEASAPQTIVDTEDYIVDHIRTTAPESFPALAAFLHDHYTLVGRGTATIGHGFSVLVDVYLRRPTAASP